LNEDYPISYQRHKLHNEIANKLHNIRDTTSLFTEHYRIVFIAELSIVHAWVGRSHQHIGLPVCMRWVECQMLRSHGSIVTILY